MSDHRGEGNDSIKPIERKSENRLKDNEAQRHQRTYATVMEFHV